MAKNMKTRKGKDGFSYPYTSLDLVVDENGKSARKKFDEVSSQLGNIDKKINDLTLDTLSSKTSTPELSTNKLMYFNTWRLYFLNLAFVLF